MIDSIIFDMDGTLWNSTKEITIAYNKVLREKYPEVKDEVTPERLEGLFGLPMDVITVKLFQSVPKDKAIQVMKDCSDYQLLYLAEHGAPLYEGLEQVLKELSKNHKLFIVSNCQEGYIQCFFRANPHLEQYFTDFEYPGRSGKLKADNIGLVINRNNLKNPIYVGDTQGDANASKEAGIPFIFARYGFGDVREYDGVVDSLMELTKLVDGKH